jgi:hypothetical protein
MESNLNENVSTGNARRAKFGSIKQRVSSSEVISNKDVANVAKSSADAKKSAGDEAHAAATKAGKSPMEAETARNRAHRQYERAQKKLREAQDHEVSMAQAQLKSAKDNITKIQKKLGKKEKDIPAWMQAKITDTEHNTAAAATHEQKTYTQFCEVAAWQRKEGKNKEGGLNEKGRKSYERENPGSDLKAPQPEGGPRKNSFCARMKGMKSKLTSSKTANDPDSRINKSLRAWNC